MVGWWEGGMASSSRVPCIPRREIGQAQQQLSRYLDHDTILRYVEHKDTVWRELQQPIPLHQQQPIHLHTICMLKYLK
jgi:hypothetical protein